MDAKKIALLAGALIIAVATALLARNMLGSSSTPQVAAAAMPQEVATVRVLVAVKALPVGTILDPESFRYQPWPKDLVEDVYYLDGKSEPAKLAGSVVRTAITAGQPLTVGALIQPGDRGFLAAALGPGMRAVTVPVSSQAAVAGFIFPGDRVDVVLTQSVSGVGDPLKVSETILRNVRVLATDQRTNAVGDDGKPVVQNYSSVTIEVTPRIAEKVAVAQTVGSLTLALRPIADDQQELDAAIAGTDVDLPDGGDPAAEKNALIKIAAKPVDGKSTFSTGGDVSRYQRRSTPEKPEDSAKPKGPIVRVARGSSVTEVAVGGN